MSRSYPRGIPTENNELSMPERLRLVLDHRQVDPRLSLLVARAGLPALDAVLDLFGGEKPHIPSKDRFWERLTLEERNQRIYDLHDGTTDCTKRLAKQFDVSVRTVQVIIQKHREVVKKRSASDDRCAASAV